MTYIIVFMVGVLIGMMILALTTTSKINDLIESLDTQIMLRKNRDKFIKKQMETNLKLKDKINDLEKNIEFLVNNLSEQKKKIVTNGKSAN